MLWKFVSIALLAVGVMGRTVFNNYSYDPYDPYETDSRKFIDQYCNGNVTSDNALQIKSSMLTFAKCMTELIDRDTVIGEFGEATASNDYTEVCKKYCAKTSELKVCMQHLYTGLALCMTTEQVRAEENAMNALLGYTCGNNGARLASFFKEDGVQCVQSNLQVMSSCLETTDVSIKSQKENRIIYAEVGCKDREQIMTCLVKGLKECQNPVPGRYAEELREVLLKSRQCLKVPEIQTAAVVVSNSKQVDLPQNSELSKQIELLKKRKLELEVRTAEIETWHRENELRLQHSLLTSDVKSRL